MQNFWCSKSVSLFILVSPALAWQQNISLDEQRTKLKAEIETAMRTCGLRSEDALRQLQPEAAVREILLNILAEAKYTHPKDSAKVAAPVADQSFFFRIAVDWLGRLKEPRAIPAIQKVALGEQYDETTRIIATMALGRINANQSKDVLIQVLNSSKPLEYALQIKAAEALAETSDRQALNEIEKWARGETRSYQRRKLEAAAAKLREKLR
ncbi:MAG: HEAT repeat domain-containing protein [Bryobacterales bacterium]|nr:HEAT repeat domain-containing protein [Bryobacterales bacterium]